MGEYDTVQKNGKVRPAHDLIMEDLLRRPLSKDEVVHHLNGDKKDNRPENLRVMTREEHTRLHATGRKVSPLTIEKQSIARTGKANPSRRKLTPDQVREIVYALHDGKSMRELQQQYHVSENVISCIRDRKTYHDVLDEMPADLFSKTSVPRMHKKDNRKFTPEEVGWIRISILNGESIHSIAGQYHASVSTIKKIRDNQAYADIPWPREEGRYLMLEDARRLADIMLSSPLPPIENEREALMSGYGLFPTRPALLIFRLLKRALAHHMEDILLLYAISSRNGEIDRLMQAGSQLSLVMGELNG